MDSRKKAWAFVLLSILLIAGLAVSLSERQSSSEASNQAVTEGQLTLTTIYLSWRRSDLPLTHNVEVAEVNCAEVGELCTQLQRAEDAIGYCNEVGGNSTEVRGEVNGASVDYTVGFGCAGRQEFHAILRTHGVEFKKQEEVVGD